jgi:hypothetical protein
LGKKTSPHDAIPWPWFPEDFVLDELLKLSTEFAAFYQAERGKITKPVNWARDVSLPVGIDYRCTTTPTGMKVIRLRRIPAILDDATKIAHELQHLLIDAEGFPQTGAKLQFETICSSLNSMVHDPIVNSRLQAYGFNLQADYENELKQTLSQLSAMPNAPTEHIARMHWIINYVGNILEWETICGTANTHENEFQIWFDARYPDLAQEAQGLLALVKETGYDTPSKQTVLFKTIIRRYDLGRIIVLTN